jgi:hypothetical protein
MTTSLLIPAALLAAAVSVEAQRDFSGTWRLDESRSESPAWAEYVRPVVRVIRVASNSVEIDVTQGTNTSTLRYPLTQTKPTMLDTSAVANRAYWDGERLVTETVKTVNGQTVTMREELMLAADGKDLTVQRVVEVQHGYTLRGTKNNSIVRDVFVRVTP